MTPPSGKNVRIIDCRLRSLQRGKWACCALSAEGGQTNYALTGNPSVDDSTCFVGNLVLGGRKGQSGQNEAAGPPYDPYTVNISGNWFNLYPAFDIVYDQPGAAVYIKGCQTANVLGNTLLSGGNGVLFDEGCTNALIMDNDFGNVTYRGIGYTWHLNGLPPSSLPNAWVFGNILGQGVSFHTELPWNETFGWFFNRNTYLNFSGTKIAPFLDPANSAAHLSN